MSKRSLATFWAQTLRRNLKAAARTGLALARRNTLAAPKKPSANPRKARGISASAALRPAARRAPPALNPTPPRAVPANPAPPMADAGGDWISGLAVAAAGARRFHLYKPAGVGTGERLPLLVMLHGCTQDAKEFAAATRMNRLASRERFLVLYPEQDPSAHAKRCWNWYGVATGQAVGEAAIIAAAVDQVCRLYPVDATRVAVAGLSAGAAMAALLVIREPKCFRALVMHSGIAPGTAHSTLSALVAMRGHGTTTAVAPAEAAVAAATWPPLLVIHGSADATVVPSVGRAAATQWADAVGAVNGGESRVLRRGHRYPMTVTDFTRSGRNVVTLCEVEQLGHAWSGGDARHGFADDAGPDASRMVWAFANRQFAHVDADRSSAAVASA